MDILRLPLELSTHILSYLELGDLLRFCATCRAIRLALRPGAFIFLLGHFAGGHPDRVRAIDECSVIFRCHALCILFRQYLIRKDLKLLTQRGASFRHVKHDLLMEGVLVRYGAGQKLKFMLRHGASLPSTHRDVDHLRWRYNSVRMDLCNLIRVLESRLQEPPVLPYGTHLYLRRWSGPIYCACPIPIRHLKLVHLGARSRKIVDALNTLLGTVYWDWGHGPCVSVEYLQDFGADFTRVPDGIHTLLERSYLKWGLGEQVTYLQEKGADIQQVPRGLHGLLREVVLKFGTGPEMQYLLEQGASLQQVPGGFEDLLMARLVTRGAEEDLDYLLEQYDKQKLGGPRGREVLLERNFRAFGPNKHLSKLMKRYHMSMRQVPCGLDNLLKAQYHRYGVSARVVFLLRHGALFPKGIGLPNYLKLKAKGK